MRIGIDLGGTKIEAIALAESGKTLAHHRVATPRGNYPATVETIAKLVTDLECKLGQTGTVGVGIPGAVSLETGLIKNANSTWIIGRPLQHDLGEALGRSIRLANDANCFAISEATDGAGRGAEVVFGVIIGTGTGGGLVVNGRLINGSNAIAGEWGHNPLPWPKEDELPGPQCYCGKTGCIETWLSGPGFARDHCAQTGEKLTPEEIVNKMGQGDTQATASLQRYTERVSRALASVINLLDPDVIVLGGGMSNIQPLYKTVPKLWDRYVFSDQVNTRLVAPCHGDASGVRGAAWLWPPN